MADQNPPQRMVSNLTAAQSPPAQAEQLPPAQLAKTPSQGCCPSEGGSSGGGSGGTSIPYTGFAGFGSSIKATVAAGLTTALEGVFQIFDVRDYGAVGDGVTDDGPAFQAAFDAACSNTTGAVTPANRFGTVRIPPAQPGKSYRIATPVTFRAVFGGPTSAGAYYFAVEGCGADGAITPDVGTANDCLYLSTEMEWGQIRVRNLSFVGKDPTFSGAHADCRSCLHMSASAFINPTCIVQGIQIGGVWASTSTLWLDSGIQVVDDVKIDSCLQGFDGGTFAGGGYAVYVDNVVLAQLDHLYDEYEFFTNGTYYTAGLATALVGINAYVPSSGIAPVYQTVVIGRNWFAGPRTSFLFYVAPNVGSPVVHSLSLNGFNKDSGQSLGFALDLTHLELKNGQFLCNVGQLALDLRTTTEMRIQSLLTDGYIQADANCGDMRVKYCSLGAAAGGVSPSGIIHAGVPQGLASVYIEDSTGVGALGFSSAAIATQALIKQDSASDFRVKQLADADDAIICIGTSVEAVAGTDTYIRYATRNGTRMTFTSDGTAIGAGVAIYNSALGGGGGQVSAVASGQPIGVSLQAVAGGAPTAFQGISR